MGCLFGYAGLPDDTLLSGMASRLSHRCRGGWERTHIDGGNGADPRFDAFRVELGWLF